jgi:hypothetical protein
VLRVEVLEEAAALAEEHRDEVDPKIGTPSWWSPPQPPAGPKVPRPATTAPVDRSSAMTCPVDAPEVRERLGEASPSGKTHSCSRCPPSPSPLSGRSFGPAMNPSRDMDMPSTVADTVVPFLVRTPLRPAGGARLIAGLGRFGPIGSRGR